MEEGLRLERVTENEAVFRHANELIRQRVEQLHPDGPVPFICECSRPDCNGRIELTLETYEWVRGDPHRFVILRGHEESGDEEIVEELGDYVLVEKPGRPAPRSAQG